MKVLFNQKYNAQYFNVTNTDKLTYCRIIGF